MGRFLLASVYKPIAVAAGEQSPDAVQLGDAATAIHIICSNRTHKPGPLSTEPGVIFAALVLAAVALAVALT